VHRRKHCIIYNNNNKNNNNIIIIIKTNYAGLSSFDFPQVKSVDIKPKIKIT